MTNKLGSNPLEPITQKMISRVMAELGKKKSPRKKRSGRKNAAKARAALAKKRAAK